MSEHFSIDAGEPVPASGATPIVKRIERQDVFEALAQGLGDFRQAPVFGLAFGAIFTLGGLLIASWTTSSGLTYLMYPFIVGFAMIGPFAAVGLYEVSRLREAGVKPTWGGVFSTLASQAGAELAWMGFVALFLVMSWVYAAQILVAIFFGLGAFSSMHQFISLLTSTPEGFAFMLVGNAVGAAILFAIFSLTVVSVPLLLDRDVDFVTAMITSLKAVGANLGPMLLWAAIIMGALLLGCAPAFLGLLIVVPVLSFATWRLYRKLVAF